MSADTLVVDFRCRRGDFEIRAQFCAAPGVTVLAGPSGSGKSTTLAAIAGLVRPTQGRICFAGETWFDAEARVEQAIHKRGIAYVFQQHALFLHMNALQNVAYGIRHAGSARERRTRGQQMLERMRVGHLAKRRPRTFSGGEAQRVALARAFASEPRLVLLDEAFSSLDPELRDELGRDLKSYIETAQIPAIQVTHRPEEALGRCVVRMENGSTIADADLTGPGVQHA